MVPEDSSAARMPRPGATIASATLFNSARFIGASFVTSWSQLSQTWPGFCRLFARLQRAGSLLPQYLHTRQRLAFEPLQEGAARGRHIGEPPGHPGRVEGGDRIATARH